MKIKNVEIPSRLCLAPMAGVTDIAFRAVCREMGAGLTYSEMVSSKGLCYNDEKSKTLLRRGKSETPYAVQIFGSDPVCMADAAQMALEISGADILDINMGCPVGKVVKSGDGSALMRTPEKAEAVLKAVVSAVSVPVTVKIRKGWDGGSVNAVEFAVMAEACGVSAIAVHGRTRAQMYVGNADWDIIRSVKAAVSVPVIANGDIFEGRDAKRILDYTGADMAMVGRGSFGNPWLFRSAQSYLDGEGAEYVPTMAERVDTAMRQFEMAAQYKSEKTACLEARKHFAWYLRGVPHSAVYKNMISSISTLREVREIAEELKRVFR